MLLADLIDVSLMLHNDAKCSRIRWDKGSPGVINRFVSKFSTGNVDGLGWLKDIPFRGVFTVLVLFLSL